MFSKCFIITPILFSQAGTKGLASRLCQVLPIIVGVIQILSGYFGHQNEAQGNVGVIHTRLIIDLHLHNAANTKGKIQIEMKWNEIDFFLPDKPYLIRWDVSRFVIEAMPLSSTQAGLQSEKAITLLSNKPDVLRKETQGNKLMASLATMGRY